MRVVPSLTPSDRGSGLRAAAPMMEAGKGLAWIEQILSYKRS